jgi:pimeloyl-ACP methyl ester carboxylesterase
MSFSCSAALAAFLLLGPDPVDVRFVQVAPAESDGEWLCRSAGQRRAVVLIHGVVPHPVNSSIVPRARLSGWEKPGSMLVRELARHADVFSLGYGQNAAVDDVARAPGLHECINRLRAMGYDEIILIGHSAGALIARYFVEDWPGSGVTKVIQVCAPNAGSGWGHRTVAVRFNQEVFITSMTREARAVAPRTIEGRSLPPEVEFVSVVGLLGPVSDGVVRADSQWPADLQRQGVPAVVLPVSHITAMRSRTVARKLAQLVIEPAPRWSAEQVEAMRQQLFGPER